ncbi:MAG: phage head closure protein [Bacteroidales bacterium]|nr:phage head closure protein [Bacteroidales bacterium]
MRDYRHKIDFLRQSKKQDDYGESSEYWRTYKRGIWASKDPLLGNEYFNALTVNSKVEVKFNMRYVDGITNEMRIRHGEEKYEILSAINVKGLSRELLCYCRLVKE